jgi:hypothetical protein
MTTKIPTQACVCHMGVVYKRIPVGCVPSVHVFIMSLMGVFVMKFNKECVIFLIKYMF